MYHFLIKFYNLCQIVDNIGDLEQFNWSKTIAF